MKLISLTSKRYSDITKIYLSNLQLKGGDTFTLFSFEDKGDEDFGTPNYNLATKEMMRICWETLKGMQDGELMMYTDNDVIFNAPFSDFDCGKDDIRFQKDAGIHNLCLGFFVVRKNPATVRLFEYLYNNTTATTNCQIAINNMIWSVKYSFFDISEVCNYSAIAGDKIWNGEEFTIPPCKAFHANYTIGLENKLKLLRKCQMMSQS